MPSDQTFYLVSCVSKKRRVPAPAKDLYVSEWFLRARAFVEATGCPWFILSAKYGLVAPDQVVAPYEETLNSMAIAGRRAWARRVEAQLDEHVPDFDRVVVLAGQRYREFLIGYLSRRWVVEVPLEGLRIGEQLSWLGRGTP
jgi:hypothetical protein